MIAPPGTAVPARYNPAAELVFTAAPGAPDRMQPQVALQQQASRGQVQQETAGQQKRALLGEYVRELQAKSGTPAKIALAEKVNALMAAQPIATPADAIMQLTGMS